MKRHLTYLCLEPMREGHASYSHVSEIIHGLERREWLVNLYAPSYIESGKLPHWGRRLLEFIRVQIKLWVSSGFNTDIIYIRIHYASLLTALVAKIFQKKMIVEVNGTYEDVFIAWPWTRKFSPLFIWAFRTQLKWAEAVITVTPFLKRWIIDEIRPKLVSVIPNGANTQLFHPNAQYTDPIRLVPDSFVVFFGALTAWQGIETLLTSIDDPEWPEGVQLVIVGDGFARSQVENVATRNPRLSYLGPVPYSSVPQIVARSIASVIPNTNLGNRSSNGLSPLKMYESMACGVPVIITDFPGQADLIRDNSCGIVIPPEDSKALAHAVAYIYMHPTERKEMGQLGRKCVDQEHSWDKRASDTELVLLKILNIDRNRRSEPI